MNVEIFYEKHTKTEARRKQWNTVVICVHSRPVRPLLHSGLYAPSRSQTKFDEHATKTIIMAVASFLYAHRNALIFFTVLCYLLQVFLLPVFMTPDTCLVALGKQHHI